MQKTTILILATKLCVYCLLICPVLLLIYQSSVKMKLLCAQVMNDLLGEGIDVRVINNIAIIFSILQLRQLNCLFYLFFQYDKVTKLTADAKFGKLSSYWLYKLELLGTLNTQYCHFNLQHHLRQSFSTSSFALSRAQAKKKLLND